MHFIRLRRAFAWIFFCLTLPTISAAEMVSLMGGDAFQNARRSLLQPATAALDANTQGGIGSLFAGQGGLGLFAPQPKRSKETVQQASLSFIAPQGDMSRSALILDLISKAEAGPKGYDAVQYGARQLPSKRPTQMTISDIYQWIDQTPGQPHAIGRYQFIPATLRRLVKEAGLNRHETFSPRVQDILATALLKEAGLEAVNLGQMDRQTFMNNLARIWAGLPNSTGRSHYDGQAGNRATMTWARFDTEMRKIFPS